MAKKIDNTNELEALRAKVAELEAEKLAKEESASGEGNYLKEMRELRAKGPKSASTITYKDIHDHRNIPLYHINGIHIGKVVGPIHPDNAEQYFNNFLQKGIKLSIHKPSPEFVEKYKKSAEYIKIKEKFDHNRSLKRRQKKDVVEELTKIIAKKEGVDPSSLNRIRSREEVGIA